MNTFRRMKDLTISTLPTPVLFVLFLIGQACAFSDRILLQDLKVLTLYHGKTTTARRSSPIPQLKCIGGTAGCSSFTPQVVQCYNRGTDGYDVQWECKTDMDNAYRFGRVEVSCEGYDYPDDPYVLKGSCGLEYTMDLTKEGFQKNNNKYHNYYGDHQGSSYSYKIQKGSGFGDLILLGVVGVIIYAIYKTCLANNGTGDNSDRSDYAYRQTPRGNPPPPGFREEYMPGGCSSNYGSSYTGMPGFGTATNGGGFWTGAATGGLLGYLFGARGNTGYYQQPYHQPYSRGWTSGWGSGWGPSWGASTGSSWGSGASSSFSSGTRSASGFGGTRRR